VYSIGPDGRGGVGLGDGDALAVSVTGEFVVGAGAAGWFLQLVKASIAVQIRGIATRRSCFNLHFLSFYSLKLYLKFAILFFSLEGQYIPERSGSDYQLRFIFHPSSFILSLTQAQPMSCGVSRPTSQSTLLLVPL
jgi:hypothetical protein